LSQDQ